MKAGKRKRRENEEELNGEKLTKEGKRKKRIEEISERREEDTGRRKPNVMKEEKWRKRKR